MISVPFCVTTFIYTGSFWGSIASVVVGWFITELWISPTLTMLQNSTSQKNQATILSVWFLFTSLCGMVSTGTLGLVNSSLDTANHPEYYGYTLFVADTLGKILSIPVVWESGKMYKEFMERMDQ